MSLGEIDYINVVTEACTVLGIIVISENAQALALSDRSLCDERNEVVRNASWEFADKG
jgi:hypothetical protein